MDKFEFISSIIKSVAWPSVIFFIVLVLRKPIIKIISNLNKLTYNNLQVDFANQLDELDSNLDVSSNNNGSQLSPQSRKEKEIMTVAQISPAAAITMSWTMLEQEILNTVKRLAISPDYPLNNSPLKNIQILSSAKLISPDTEKTLIELRRMRNESAHVHNVNESLTSLDAIKYFELSTKVTKILRKLER